MGKTSHGNSAQMVQHLKQKCKLQDTHRVQTHAILLYPNSNANLDLSTPKVKKTTSLLGYPKVIKKYTTVNMGNYLKNQQHTHTHNHTLITIFLKSFYNK